MFIVYTAKELLGHKSIKMTMRYSHLSQDHKKKAVETLGDTIGTNKAPSQNILTRGKFGDKMSLVMT
jgi:hypothetical protein